MVSSKLGAKRNCFQHLSLQTCEPKLSSALHKKKHLAWPICAEAPPHAVPPLALQRPALSLTRGIGDTGGRNGQGLFLRSPSNLFVAASTQCVLFIPAMGTFSKALQIRSHDATSKTTNDAPMRRYPDACRGASPAYPPSHWPSAASSAAPAKRETPPDAKRDPAPRLPHARNNPAGGGGRLRGLGKSMAHAANKHKASQSPGGVWACTFCQATQAQTQWIACKRLEEGWHQRRREAASGLLLQSLQILRHHEGYDVPWSRSSDLRAFANKTPSAKVSFQGT